MSHYRAGAIRSYIGQPLANGHAYRMIELVPDGQDEPVHVENIAYPDEPAERLSISRAIEASDDSGGRWEEGRIQDPHDPTVFTSRATHTKPGVHLGVDWVSIAGTEHPNQDLWGVWGDIVWVIDGATRATSPAGTVEAYVQRLSDALSDAAGHTPDAPLTDILTAAITATATTEASATIAMARATTDGFDWLVLGDARIWTSPEAVITDDRLAHIAVTERDQRSRILAEQGPGEAYDQATAVLWAVEDAHRNVPGGFWVAGGDPAAARQALVGHTTADTVLLASDGLDAHSGLDVGALFTGDLDAAVVRARGELSGVIDDITVVRATR